MKLAKSLIERILMRRELELKDVRKPLRKQKAFFDFVKSRGFRPETIIDVGVGPQGTPWLMEAWPDAYTVLIEPNARIEGQLKTLLQGRHGEIHLVGAGAAEAGGTLKLNTNQPSSSSMYTLSKEQIRANNEYNIIPNVTEESVTIKPIDMLRNEKWREPYLVKLDCEGFEMEAIKGSPDVLRRTELIISEISIANRFADSYSFHEIISILDNNDFQIYDIVDMLQFGRTGKLSAIDAVFVKKNSPLLT